ncbi:MAG TPA: bifunctional serine/threonine-protein kinase/formylglycine-generating enzyme family protein [Pseudomonadota bacterium]|nr:bifunctional serine/threonine-protein kinase/formylglycine-generating enzyme family protein [Pseudomonadota bacterium]
MNAESAETANPLPEIAGYRVLRRLGQGGMAEVYLAIQLSLQREVAIKLLALENAVSDELAQRFEREARTIARLDHPHIVGIHEVGRSSTGLPYYTMPYLPNGDLGRRRLRGDSRAVLSVLRALVDALAYAHAHGVVHRDVKPDNVLFDKNDRPLLTDFGIALATTLDHDHRVTERGRTLGSSGYMSPEQARGSDVDARADLYSLGVVCHELLTGDLPFQGIDALSMAMAHVEDPVPRLPAALAAWQPFLDRAMAKSPNDRYQDAAEMRAGLDAVERALDAPPVAPPARSWRLPLLAALLAAVAVYAAARFGSELRPPAPSGDDARAPAAAPRPAAIDPAARIAALADAARELQAGRVLEPDDGAAERYLALLARDLADVDARAGLDRSLGAAAEQAAREIGRGRGEAAAQVYDAGYAVAERSAIADYPAWAAFERRYGAALVAALDQATRRGDRKAGQALAPAVQRAAGNDAAVAAAARRNASARIAGASIQDPGGPRLAWFPPVVGASTLERGFALALTEVTRDEYATFARDSGHESARCRDGGNPSYLLRSRDWQDPGFAQAGNTPVVCVAAADAAAYAGWLSRRTGARYRLPTRAQWQHAAAAASTRGSACALGNVYDASGRRLSLAARHDCDDGHAQLAPVGSYRANALGVRDLIGNAREWLADCVRRGPSACAEQAVAGSGFRDGERKPLLATTGSHDADKGAPDIGFRLVREVDD